MRKTWFISTNISKRTDTVVALFLVRPLQFVCAAMGDSQTKVNRYSSFELKPLKRKLKGAA